MIFNQSETSSHDSMACKVISKKWEASLRRGWFERGLPVIRNQLTWKSCLLCDIQQLRNLHTWRSGLHADTPNQSHLEIEPIRSQITWKGMVCRVKLSQYKLDHTKKSFVWWHLSNQKPAYTREQSAGWNLANQKPALDRQLFPRDAISRLKQRELR